MKYVLCCADGAEHADFALRAASELSADLSLLVVSAPFGRSSHGPQALTWANDEAQVILDQTCDLVAKSGQKPTQVAIGVAREGSTEIKDHALEHDTGAIAIRTGDKGGLSRLFLGSVAMDVANRAPRAVIIAH